MNEFENIFPLLVFFIIASVFAFFLYRYFRYGGAVGMFYGRKHQKIGEIEFDRRMGALTMVVHRLEPEGIGVSDDLVLEMRRRTGLSYQMMPYKLSRQKARELADLLRQAASS